MLACRVSTIPPKLKKNNNFRSIGRQANSVLSSNERTSHLLDWRSRSSVWSFLFQVIFVGVHVMSICPDSFCCGWSEMSAANLHARCKHLVLQMARFYSWNTPIVYPPISLRILDVLTAMIWAGKYALLLGQIFICLFFFYPLIPKDMTNRPW